VKPRRSDPSIDQCRPVVEWTVVHSSTVHLEVTYVARCWDPETVMDLNYFFRRQQIERSLAESANCDEARHAHEEMALAYEQAIERKSRGQIVFASKRK
jgi:hypothetical protein